MKKILICFIVFVVTGLGSAFLGVPGDATFIVGGVCAFLYLILSRKKGRSSSKKTSAKAHGSSRYSHGSKKDFFDQRNIPRHWTKARACVDGDHDKVTVSEGTATRCYMCGKPFNGIWGDQGIFDGYVCTIHKKWIPRGDYCLKCADEGLINPYE